MGVRELLLLGCGRWGSGLLHSLSRLHSRTVDRTTRFTLEAVDGETGPASASALQLVMPTAAAFREQLRGLVAQDEDRQAELAALLPAAWLEDPHSHVERVRGLDERFRYRAGMLSAEPRVRRQLQQLLRHRPNVLVVAAPDEAFSAAALTPLMRWLALDMPEREEAGGGALHLLLGLRHLGSGVSLDPAGAARAMAFLSGLDVAHLRSDEDTPATFLVAAEGRAPEAVDAAGAEAVAWWSECALREPQHVLSPPRSDAQFRGRPLAYWIQTGVTAALDLPHIVQVGAERIVDDFARLLDSSGDHPPPDLAEHHQRIVADVRSGLKIPTPELLANFKSATGGRPVEGVTASKFRSLTEALEEETERARQLGRTFLFGGSIQRMAHRVERGYLDQHVDWFWQLLVGGVACIDDVLSCLLKVGLGLDVSELREASRVLRARTEEAAHSLERRLHEHAPMHVTNLARRHVLDALEARAAVDVPLEMLEDFQAAMRKVVDALLEVKTVVHRYPSLLREGRATMEQTSWRALIPIQDEALNRVVLGSGKTARKWLEALAAASPVDPGRGLCQPPEDVMTHLRAFMTEHVAHVAVDHPAAEFPGIAAWFADVVNRVRAASVFCRTALPPCREPALSAVLLAGAKTAVPLAGDFPVPPALLPAGEPSRLGWIQRLGPVPLLAVSGLSQASTALESERAAGRQLPYLSELDPCRMKEVSRFHQPLVGDLAARVAGALAEPGAPSTAPDVTRRLASVDAAEASAALEELRRLPRQHPVLRQAGVLGDLRSLGELADLAGLERMVQELAEVDSGDRSERELMSVLDSLAGVATPVKKYLELSTGPTAVVFLTKVSEVLVDVETSVHHDLTGCERVVLLAMLARWKSWVTTRLTELRGRSVLTVRLRTRRLLLARSTSMLVEVANEGEHPALVASLQLLGSSDFRILGQDVQVLPEMAPGDRRTLQFEIKPQGGGRLPVELRLSWDDLEASGKRAEVSDEVELIEEAPSFKRIDRNPYIAGPPVRSEEMFFGRHDVFSHISENLAGRFQDNILVLHGQRRTGKSSILCQLERRDLLPEHVPVLLDLQGLGGFDTAGLLYQLARHASRRLKRRLAAETGQGAPPMPERAEFEASPYDAFQDHVDELEDILDVEGKRLLFMIDEFEVLEGRVAKGSVDEEIFPFIRNLMQHRERVAFLLSGTQQLVEMSNDYWSILFSLASFKKVSFLSAGDAKSLIEEPLRGEIIFDDLVIENMLHLTAGHPYYLQLTCQNLVQRLNETASHAWVTPADLEAVLPDVLSSGTGHFQYEWKTLGSPLARCALAAMAEEDGEGLDWFSADEVQTLLLAVPEGKRLLEQDESVEAALTRLLARDVVETDVRRARWHLRTDLFRRWVRQEHPLRRAVAGEGS